MSEFWACHLYLLRTLQALAFAYAYSAGSELCVDAAPPNRLGQAIGLYGLSFIVMGAFAPAAVETLANLYSWDACFLLAAGTATLCGILSLFIHEERFESSAAEETRLFTILMRPEMRRATLVIALLGVAFGGTFNFYQPYALSLGIHELRDFFIANSISAASCRLALGPFIDRMGLRRVSLISLALYAVMLFGMTWLDQIGLIIIGLGVGAAHGVFYPAYTALILAGCPPEERGRRMALIQGGLNIGIGFAGVALGWIAASYGYPVIFQIASGALVVAGLLIASAPGQDSRRRR